MQEKGDAALGSAAGADSFSPHADCPSALCFFVSSFLCFFSIPLSPLPRSWSKESADTSAAARPPLSALFYFSCERVGCGCLGGGAGIENKRDGARGSECGENHSVLPPHLVSFLLHPPLALSSLITLTFIPLPLFPLILPLFFLLFCLISACPFLVDNADTHPRTHCGRTHAQRWYPRERGGSSRWKDYLLNQRETVSKSESIVTVRSI